MASMPPARLAIWTPQGTSTWQTTFATRSSMHGSGRACTTTFQAWLEWSLDERSGSTTSGTRFDRSTEENLHPNAASWSFVLPLLVALPVLTHHAQGTRMY